MQDHTSANSKKSSCNARPDLLALDPKQIGEIAVADCNGGVILAEDLGTDPDALPIDQSMRLETVFALKLSLDEMRSRLYRGEAVDTSKMLSVAEALERYLPEQPKPKPAPHGVFDRDPHKVLEDIVNRWIEADEASKA